MLVLVRHGQTDANAGGRLQGRIDPPLTPLGQRQAEALARVVRPDVVVTSPLLRARQTAAAFGVEVREDARWTELHYGELDGLPLSDVPAVTWDRWRTDVAFAPPGGESLQEVGTRVREACAELSPVATEQVVVVVSHVSPIKAAVAWALGVSELASWRMFLDVAAICRVRTSGTVPSLLAFNERSHLDGLGSG